VVPEERPPSTDQHASQLIVDSARARPGEITLISTGPMTNVALAVVLEPRLPDLLDRWIFMGGAFGVPGNTTPAAEFNIHADPEAAQRAIAAFAGASTRPVAVGLDVTHQVRMLPHHIEALAELAGDSLEVSDAGTPWGEPASPLLAYLEGALRKYAEYHHQLHGFYGVYLHDPLTVAIATDPTLATLRPVAADVECHGALTVGETVADWRSVWRRPPNLDVATAIDVDRIFEVVVSRIGALVAGA
jgi:purine nucleosidase